MSGPSRPPGPPADSKQTYVWLSRDGAAEAVPAEGFWDDLAAVGARAETHPYLVGVYDFAEDFPHWEMHPEGEEVFIAQSGDYTLLLDHDGARSEHSFKGGQTFVIPRGAWHFLKVREPGRIVVITAGRDTRHRPMDQTG